MCIEIEKKIIRPNLNKNAVPNFDLQMTPVYL